MYKIDGGLQYDVYDIGHGQVRKIPKTGIGQLLLLASWGWDHNVLIHPWKIRRVITEARSIGRSSLEGLQARLSYIDPELLGNPLFLEREVYEQDHVVPLGTALQEVSEAESYVLIDRYIECIYRTWQYGFSDIVFNFTINNGVNKKGEVILIDLGELTFEKAKVAELVLSKIWEHRYSYRTSKKIVRDYFRKAMSEWITVGVLDQIWNNQG